VSQVAESPAQAFVPSKHGAVWRSWRGSLQRSSSVGCCSASLEAPQRCPAAAVASVGPFLPRLVLRLCWIFNRYRDSFRATFAYGLHRCGDDDPGTCRAYGLAMDVSVPRAGSTVRLTDWADLLGDL